MADHPTFNLAEIERRRDRLVERVLLPHYNVTITGETLDCLTHELLRALPEGVTRDTLFESIRYLAGHELHPEEAMRLAWRLSGNMPQLRAGFPVPPWSIQHEDEWVPVHIVQTMPSLNDRRQKGTLVTFRVLAGTPCPMKITTFWKPGLTKVIAGKLGFSAPWGKYPFHRAPELVNMRLLTKVIAARSTSRPFVYDIACPDSLVNRNREEVLRYRFRVDPEHACPYGWLHPCHRCAVGYETCPAGTHYRTYETGACDGCGNADALFDPELDSVHCIDCTIRERMRHAANH